MKIISAVVIILAMPIASLLLAENAINTTDSAQENITDIYNEPMTASTNEPESYMMTSQFTDHVSTGNTVAENGGFNATVSPAGGQQTSTTITFPGYLKLYDDGKNGEINASTSPSFFISQLTATTSTLDTVLSDKMDTMRHNGDCTETTSVAETEHEQIITPQDVHFNPHSDAKNVMMQFGGTGATTVSDALDVQESTTSPTTLFTTSGEVKTHSRKKGELRYTEIEASRGDDSINPEYFHFIPHVNIKDSVFSDKVDTVRQNGDCAETTSVAETEHEQIITPQDVNFKPHSDARNVMMQFYGTGDTTVSDALDVQESTTSPATLFTTSGEVKTHSRKKGDLRYSEIEASPEDDTINPEYLHFIPHVSVKDTVLSDKMDTMRQNGDSTETTSVAETEHEQIITPQDVHFNPQSDAKNVMMQFGGTGVTTVSDALDVQESTTSPATFFTTSGEVKTHSRKKGELRYTEIEASRDDDTINPEYVHFVPHVSIKDLIEQGHKFSGISAPPVEEISTTTSSPSESFNIPRNDKNVRQQNGGRNDTILEDECDDLETTTTQYLDTMRTTGNTNLKEQEDEINTTPSGLEVATTTMSSSLFTIPGVVDGLTQYNFEPSATTFEADYDEIETTTPQDGEFSTTIDPSAEEIVTTTISASFLPTVPTNNVSVRQQNGEPTDEKFEVFYDDEVTSTPQDGEFSTTMDPSAEEIETTTISASFLPTVPTNNVSVGQQNGEPTDEKFEVAYDDEVTSTPQYYDIIPDTGNNNSNELDDDFYATTASSDWEVGTITTVPSVLPTIPGDSEGNFEATATTFVAENDGTEPTTHQNGQFISGKDKFIEWPNEFESITLSEQHFLPTSKSQAIRVRVQAEENDTKDLGHQEDGTSTLISKQNEDKPTATTSSEWVILSARNKSNKTKVTPIFGTKKNSDRPFSFLEVFNILAARNNSNLMMSDESNVTANPPRYEEVYATTLSKEDPSVTPKNKEVDGNETVTPKPSNNERSPDEIMMMYDIHMKMLKGMSVTLAGVVILIMFNFGCRYMMKRIRGNRTAAPPEDVAPNDAAQPSTSAASASEEPRVRFQELLSREDN